MLDSEAIKTPLTDEWWITRLANKLGEKYPRLHLLELWAQGKPPITTVNSADKFYAQKITAREESRVHLAYQIVEGRLNRLHPETFKTSASDDDNGDEEANRIWKRNRMGKRMRKIIEDALIFGEGYALVESREVDGETLSTIHAESPWQVITEQDPQDPERVIAALKIYRNLSDTEDVAVLYRFDENDTPYQRDLRLTGTSKLPAKDSTGWRLSGDWNWSEPEDLETTELPVVYFSALGGVGVFENHIGALARVNEGVYKREFISTSQAWKQRWINKPKPPEEEDTDQTYDQIVSNADSDDEDNENLPRDYDLTEEEENALFAAVVDSNPGTVSIFPHGTELKESGTVDFRQLLEATKDDIRFLGESTNTLFTMAISEATNMSTSGADGIRERADQSARTIIENLKPSLETLLSLAFEIEGDEERADIAEIESIWKPVREIPLKERADSYKVLVDGGVSKRTAMKVALNLTPTQIVEEENNIMSAGFMLGVTPETPTTEETNNNAAETSDSTDQPAGATA